FIHDSVQHDNQVMVFLIQCPPFHKDVFKYLRGSTRCESDRFIVEESGPPQTFHFGTVDRATRKSRQPLFDSAAGRSEKRSNNTPMRCSCNCVQFAGIVAASEFHENIPRRTKTFVTKCAPYERLCLGDAVQFYVAQRITIRIAFQHTNSRNVERCCRKKQ